MRMIVTNNVTYCFSRFTKRLFKVFPSLYIAYKIRRWTGFNPSQHPVRHDLEYIFRVKIYYSRSCFADARDGLKPVQRRILYAMYKDGNTYEKAFRKSAKTVGNVIGNYHPHGDSSVYDAMVVYHKIGSYVNL